MSRDLTLTCASCRSSSVRTLGRALELIRVRTATPVAQHRRRAPFVQRSRRRKDGDAMATRLNERAFTHAKSLIEEGLFVDDDRDAWSEHQPPAEKENSFIADKGWSEYAKWHLGIDDEADEDTKQRYKFPYGDFHKVHRCGLLAAESRAGQYKYLDIEQAAAHLHGMIDAESRAHATR
jgi:hypothetical protein